MRAGSEIGTRRSVVPEPARRSPWFAAVWTGLGTVVVCAVAGIVVVAVCWLPDSGSGGRTNSAIRAGLLTFLASVHGGITVDGVNAAWLPLGMLVIVGLVAWRAGSGLGDVVSATGERGPVRLGCIGAAQAGTFTLGCLIAVPFATLGTSRAPFFGVALASFLVFTVSGGVGYVRASPLREWCVQRLPEWTWPLTRAAVCVVAIYLAAGALLVAGSLVLHHGAAETLSRQVGGGLAGVPVLLLGMLAAPNAAIAASAYLAGPGFALGSGTAVGLFGATTGSLPAFPVLAAVPSGPHAGPVAIGMAAATPLFAGIALARLALRADGWWWRLGGAAAAAGLAGVVMLVLGWQGGGAVGDGRLHTVGASPWQFGGAVAGAVAVVALVALGLVAGWRAVRTRTESDEAPLFEFRRLLHLAAGPDEEPADEPEDDSLAG